jgi:CRP-like cAMP-binding protein
MSYTKTTVRDFIATVPPFDQLSSNVLSKLAEQFQLLRYRMGQAVLVRDRLPAQLSILYEGQARFLAYDPRTQKPITLEMMQPGAILGWVGLVRGVPCETAIASTEVVCLVLSATDFVALLDQEPQLAAAFHGQCPLIEAFDLLGAELHRQANGDASLKELAAQAQAETVVCNLPAGKTPVTQLEQNRLWIVSGGGAIAGLSIGSRLDLSEARESLEVTGTRPARLIGFPALSNAAIAASTTATDVPLEVAAAGSEIPYAPDRLSEADPILLADERQPKAEKYPFVRGRGTLDAATACFQMLAQHLNLPFRRDVIRRILINQMQRTGGLSLELSGSIAEMMGLQAQLVNIPASALGRLEAPVLLQWQDTFALIYEINERELIAAIPDMGIVRRKPADFAESWGEQGQVLMLKTTTQTPQQRFGLQWFLPSIVRYRRVLIEVFVASFFVQLFALANPLMVQVIIDKVIVQKSVDTLQVLGIFLL